MSPLCYLLLLLIFITIPTLIYTLYHLIKRPPTATPPSPDTKTGNRLPTGRVEQLVTIIDVARVESAEEEARGDCPVCLSPFGDGERLWQLKWCSHHFHAPCIEPWLRAHSSCPVCRALVICPSRGPALV